ncbi:MAG: carboxypeptidase-like regulatory domain-containing protein [Aggregatilineales bacterium]
MRRIQALILPLLIALAFALRVGAQNLTEMPASDATRAGTIEGRVAFSDGLPAPLALEVSLYILDERMAESVFATVTTDRDGAFTFTDVPIHPMWTYAVATEYEGAVFASQAAQGDPNEPFLSLPITLYGFTDDPANIAIDTWVAHLSLNDGELVVIELIGFTNRGERAYRSADGASSIELHVPEGVHLIEMMHGSARYRFSEDGRVVFDTRPVIPGQPHTVHLIYALPYDGELSITRTLDYPLLNGFEILNDMPGVRVSGAGIVPLGGRSTALGSAMAFGDQTPLPAGERLTFTVSGVPEIAEVSANPASTLSTPIGGPTLPPAVAIFVIIGVSALALGALIAIRERSARLRTSIEVPAESEGQDAINVLVRQIAALDLQRDTMDAEVYAQQRSQMKAQLRLRIRQQAQE